MMSTHWSHSDDPEQWLDNPEPTPEEAARQVIEHEDCDIADDLRDDLLRGGSPIQITVHGYRETSAPLHDGEQFDGYEPGCTYFAPTGEMRTVRISIVYEANA